MTEERRLSEKETAFVVGIMRWGSENYRDFVWRRENGDIFVVLVSEFLLRKTKSETVDRFMKETFLRRYHTFCDVAADSMESLKEILRPLGLHNQRAPALYTISETLCKMGRAPTYQEILKLPHCGRYIASAVDCFFWKSRRPIVDHNVQRVFNRYFSLPKAVEIHKAEHLWRFAERLLPERNFVEYNYHLLDFSALVCRPRSPRCDACPIRDTCDNYLSGRGSYKEM